MPVSDPLLLAFVSIVIVSQETMIVGGRSVHLKAMMCREDRLMFLGAGKELGVLAKNDV